jgi:hypothetical protein
MVLIASLVLKEWIFEEKLGIIKKNPKNLVIFSKQI